MSTCSKFGTFIPKIGIVGAIWGSDKKVVKIQNIFKKFLCMVDWHDKTDFWIQNFFPFRPFFWSFFKYHGSKKCPSKKSCCHKKSVFTCPSTMRRNIWYLFTSVLYFYTFLPELQMAASIPILRISVPNLVQGHLRTWSWLIWVTVLILIRVGLY